MANLNIEDDIAYITLDNGKANAFGTPQIEQVTAALNEARNAATAVVVAGSPGMFSAGFDLKEIKQGPEAMAALLDRGGQMLLDILEHPQPVVAACTGHAIALGALVLLACDSRLGADGEFKIGLNETQIGIELPVYGHALVAARVPAHRRRNVILEAALHDPADAAELGFLDEVVPADAVLTSAGELAARLAEYPAHVYATHKSVLVSATVERIRAGLATG